MSEIQERAGGLPNHLGFEVEEWRDGYARVGCEVVPELLNFAGIMHGGAIMALADQAAGMSGLWCSVPGNVRYGVTVDLNCRFANRVPPGRVVAEAKVVSQGRSTYFVQFEIFDVQHKLVAFGSSTHRVRKGSESLEGVPGPSLE